MYNTTTFYYILIYKLTKVSIPVSIYWKYINELFDKPKHM